MFELAFDSAAVGMGILTLEGAWIKVNRSLCDLLGFEQQEFLKKSVFSITHPDDIPAAEEHFKQLIEGKVKSCQLEKRFLHKEGRVIWALLTLTQVRLPDWTIGVIGQVQDITARKVTESDSKKAHAEAELFIDSVPSILIGLDSEGVITRWNSAAVKTFGISPFEAIGQPLRTCGVRWEIAQLDRELKRDLTSQPRIPWHDLPYERNGEQRLLGFVVSRINAVESKAEFLLVGADITERRRAELDSRWKTAFLQALTDSTGDGILVVSSENKKILQNDSFLKLFDVPKEVAEDIDDTRLLSHVRQLTLDPDQFLQRVAFLYERWGEISCDDIKLKDGRILERYSSPVLGTAGEHYGRIWVFRDVTQRKRNEEKLRQLSQAVEQSPVSVIITDLRGNITYVNPKFVECTGYSAEEVLGKNPRILNSNYFSSDNYKELWTTITAGGEWRGIFRNKKKNGDLYWESAVITPIQDEDGSISHYIAIKEDITQQHLMEAQLRQSQKLEAIGQLAAGIAHEINTPLQFIGDNTRFVQEAWASLETIIPTIGNASLSAREDGLRTALEQTDLNYLQTEVPCALKQSLDGIQRVTTIVQAMKAFSHPESEGKDLADLNKAIETTLIVARNELKYVADIETYFATDMKLVPCHLGEFNQVILNLLVNAAHAIAVVVGDGSKGKGVIRVRSKIEGNFAEVSVEDTGAGIPEAIRPRIFEPFFTTKGVGRGTGQGLALAYASIVKKHGGAIWFETEVGKGTTFFVRLPLAG